MPDERERERDTTPEPTETVSEPAEETAPTVPDEANEAQAEPANGEGIEAAPEASEPAEATDATDAEPESAEQEATEEDGEDEEEDIDISYEVTDAGPCRKTVAVTIDREVVDREMDEQLTELVKTVAPPGFRPGRAPRRIVEKRYGKALADQVKRDLAARGMQKAMTEADLSPLGEPDLGEIELEDGGPLSIEATMDVRPTVAVEDYEGLNITKRAVSVGEKEIDRAMRSLLERRSRLVPVVDPDAVIGEEDLVVCDYRLALGDEALAERTDITIPMQLPQWPDIPELGTERLLGAKAQGTVETTFELTDEKWTEEQRGQQAALTATVHEIKRLELPELTPELLEEFGADSEDALHASIEMMLLRDMEGQVQREVEEQVERQLLEQAAFDLPESLVADQAARGAERAHLRMMEMGVQREQIEERAEELAEASRSRAERDLKLRFILNHIADREGIACEPRDIENRLARMASGYGVSPRQVRLWLEKDGSLGAMELMIREQKTTDWLIEHATIEELEPEVDVEAAAPEGT